MNLIKNYVIFSIKRTLWRINGFGAGGEGLG